jgi:ribosome modulation factor
MSITTVEASGFQDMVFTRGYQMGRMKRGKDMLCPYLLATDQYRAYKAGFDTAAAEIRVLGNYVSEQAAKVPMKGR